MGVTWWTAEVAVNRTNNKHSTAATTTRTQHCERTRPSNPPPLYSPSATKQANPRKGVGTAYHLETLVGALPVIGRTLGLRMDHDDDREGANLGVERGRRRVDAELSNKTAVDVQLVLDRDQHVGNGREQILTLLKLQRLVRRLLTHVTMFIARLARLGAILSHKRNVLGCRGWRKGKGGEEVRGKQ